MNINLKDQNQENTEKKYKKYDISDASDYSIETLASMKEILIRYWDDDFREDQYSDKTEAEHEELLEKIRNADELELFNRLGGIGYAFEELEDVYTGKIALERVYDHPVLSFKAWDFTTEEELVIEHVGLESNIFRLDYYKEDDSYIISVSNHDEYTIHEEVTYMFDLDELIKECIKQEHSNENVIHDHANLMESILENDSLGEEEVIKFMYALLEIYRSVSPFKAISKECS